MDRRRGNLGTDFGAVPPGVQPQDDGRLVCLQCGQTFVSLGHHVSRGHGLSPAEYRRRHQLPATVPLLVEAARARLADRARAQYPTNAALHEAGTRAGRRGLRAALRGRRDSASRRGTQIALDERVTARSEEVRRTTRARYDAQAHHLGYDGIVDLLIRTAHWREDRLAHMLGVSASTAGRIRHTYLPAIPGTRLRLAYLTADGRRVGVPRKSDG